VATALAPPGEEPKDLGFGTVVGGERQKRLLNRDGTFTSRREGFPPLSYLNGYHALLTISWPRFLGIVTVSYVVVNALFAWAYMLCGSEALGGLAEGLMGGAFLRAFFFSVETFATIGYGHVYPVGAAANWLVTVESLVGIFFAALLTGLIFARFSRPTAALWFSRIAVVAPYQGATGFMFRVTNARSNQLMELEAKVLYSRLDGTVRRYDQLKLERTSVVFFPLSWTIVHPINESSPLWGKMHVDLVAEDAEFDILLSGIDETFSQLVHARTSYKPEEITFGVRFTTIYNPLDADGTVSIDVSRLSDVEPAPLDDDGVDHTQTFRHTGHFTGFVPPRSRR
jgi:inward rectifier potassium channel